MACLQSIPIGAQAFEIESGNPDLTMRWDTTIKYSLAARVKEQDPVYTGANNANGDDGNRNFNRGVVSNRLDVFTEADLVWQQRFGLRMSGAAYYDTVYNKNNDNPGFAGGAFPNNASVAYNEFTADTRKWMGRRAELLDAFVFGKFELGESTATVRAGQHGLVWGESLFFGANAIAGGMMPVDAVKLASVPATQFKEAIRPVPMLSGAIQVTPQLSLGAYYQFKWERSLIPPAGSYLSTADFLDYGGEQLLLGPAGAAIRLADRKPSNSGQGGLQLRFRGDETDYGVYLVRYNEKGPQGVPVLGVIPGVGPIPTGYYLAYNQGVTALAFSASRSFGLFNVAAEAGIRRNSSLASTQGADASALAPPGVISPTDVTGNPGYATGKTAHINVSTLATLPESAMWREATLLAEIAWNRALSITKNAAAVDPNSTRDGVALRVVLEPTYRSVFPGVDISVPVGLGWAPNGSRPLAAGGPPAWIPQDGGDFTLGLNGSWRDAWRFTLNYTHYYGSKAPVTDGGIYTWKQPLADRDFVAASLRYSF
jgi:hypothetical protein